MIMNYFSVEHVISIMKCVLWRMKGHAVSLRSHVAGVKLRGQGKVTICDKVSFRTSCIINLSDGAEISIGEDTFFNDDCRLNARKRIAIGKRVQIGQGVCMYDHDHDYRNLEEMRYRFWTDDIEIGDDVWIGSNVIILRGTRIGARSVIGAGTVVKGDIPADSLVYTDRHLAIKPIIRKEQ